MLKCILKRPAQFRRAFFVVVLASLAPVSMAQQPSLPSANEAGRILEQFRNSGIPGQYYLQFELRALPRRGPEKVYQGQMWGARNEKGAITRIELTDGAGMKHRLLVQNGADGGVWRLSAGKIAKLDVAGLFQPLLPDLEITAFDLQMPYLYWPNARLEGVSKIRGRPAHAFVFTPAPNHGVPPDVAAVRMHLDTQFNQPMQWEVLGPNRRPVKTFSLLNLKTVEGQPIPKSADYRNEVTRNKTRLQVTAAAINLSLPDTLFAPANLNQDVRPPAEKLVRFEP